MKLLRRLRRFDAARALRRFTHAPRRGPRVFGAGIAKTGTNSLAHMYADRVAADHECDADTLIDLVIARERTGDAGPLERSLKRRDWWRNLKMDVSQVNVYLIDELERLFPDSRYVLTVRPCAPWLESIVNDSLRRNTTPVWMRFRDFRFGIDAPFPAQEAPLEQRGLYQIGGYLRYWADGTRRVLDAAPPDRLLVVRTEELFERSAEIADFCGVPGGAVKPDRAHQFRNPQKFGVLHEIDRAYLLDRMEEICGPLSARLFPGLSLAESLERTLDVAG